MFRNTLFLRSPLRGGGRSITIDRRLGSELFRFFLFSFSFLWACIFHLSFLHSFFSISLFFLYCILTFQLLFINAIYFQLLVDCLGSLFLDIGSTPYVKYLMSYICYDYLYIHILYIHIYPWYNNLNCILRLTCKKRRREKCINNLVICVNWACAKDLGHYIILYLYVKAYVYQVKLIPDFLYLLRNTLKN